MLPMIPDSATVEARKLESCSLQARTIGKSAFPYASEPAGAKWGEALEVLKDRCLACLGFI